tara:strand:+ start:491 stop:685 length:195 start_codon:yes stop_codon:yes gene_type:complete
VQLGQRIEVVALYILPQGRICDSRLAIFDSVSSFAIAAPLANTEAASDSLIKWSFFIGAPFWVR